jgi:Domain of unknown function (DUF4387)/Acyclic terpene utilisation family protein AtuA
MTITEPIKIVTPIGSVGYGFNIKKLNQAIEMGASAIICDAGSTDSGPQKLALGVSTVPRQSYVRDIQPMVDACYHHKVKVLISSAGGDGSDEHVDDFIKIIQDYSVEKGYKLKLIKIYGGIDKSIVHKALDAGKISPCGAVAKLTHKDVDDASRVVAQMGVEPFLDAIKEHPDYDIIIAGRSYDPSPYAAYCIANGVENLGNAFNMGKVMECGALCSRPKSKEAFATIWEDKFNVLPLDLGSICTPESLAAHSLYENSHADVHPGPGGTLDLAASWYKGQTDRSCTAGGATFHVANPYTIKLEGARVTGYRSIWMGSFRDPILIGQIDSFLETVRAQLSKMFAGEEYLLNFRLYGKDGTMGSYEPDKSVAKEIFLIGEVGAKTKELADNIASMGRVDCIHLPYPGQKGTGGNFAMPLTPLEVSLGEVCEFCIYHLMEVDDPSINFPYHVVNLGPANGGIIAKRDPSFGFDPPGTGYHIEKAPPRKSGEQQAKELKDLLTHGDGVYDDGKVALPKISEVLRSKNAGPYEICFDIIFFNMECFERAKASGELSREKIARLYGLSEDRIIACQFFKQAKAYKCTIPREGIAGSFGDRDLHASQQYVPLFGIRV